jgi:hypothetical protein
MKLERVVGAHDLAKFKHRAYLSGTRSLEKNGNLG